MGHQICPDNEEQTFLLPKWPPSKEKKTRLAKPTYMVFEQLKNFTELDLQKSKSIAQHYTIKDDHHVTYKQWWPSQGLCYQKKQQTHMEK